MKASTIFATVAAVASVASATPVNKRAYTVTDTLILQYANVLEDLEAYFYAYYLNKYSAADFAAAGQPPWVRQRIQQIASHEAEHSTFLRGALGAAAPPKCNYAFPITGVNSFLATAAVIENVGVSAYLGAAADITTPAYVTVAGSILTVEARHQAWLNSAVEKVSAWSGPFDTPLSFSPVFTIAAQFITGCDSALPLPFTDFPALTYDMKSGAVSGTGVSDADFIAVYSGLDVKTFPISGGKVTLPTGLQGFNYLLAVSTNNVTMISDATTVAGPFILDIPFNSQATNPVASF